MKDLHSYIPESIAFSEKQKDSSRLFFEDCAVFEPAFENRILASRGKGLLLGKSFFALCGVSDPDKAFFQEIFHKHPRILLPAGKDSVLIFSEAFGDTGLLLGIRLHIDATALHRVLHQIGQADFLCPDSLRSAPLTPQLGDSDLCLRLEELFYYLWRMLSPKADFSLWTMCLLIANFAGCRLERVALPVQSPPFSKRDRLRLTFFLLCSFLTMRQKDGRVGAEGNALPEEEEQPLYRCTVSLTEESREHSAKKGRRAAELPFFLCAHCFSDLIASLTEGGITLEARLPISRAAQKLSASDPDMCLCLCFSFLFSKANEICLNQN